MNVERLQRLAEVYVRNFKQSEAAGVTTTSGALAGALTPPTSIGQSVPDAINPSYGSCRSDTTQGHPPNQRVQPLGAFSSRSIRKATSFILFCSHSPPLPGSLSVGDRLSVIGGSCHSCCPNHRTALGQKRHTPGVHEEPAIRRLQLRGRRNKTERAEVK